MRLRTSSTSRRTFAIGALAGAATLVTPGSAEALTPSQMRRLRKERARLVVHHAHTENIHKFNETLDTFAHAQYQIIPTGEEPQGDDEVGSYYHDGRTTFPDQTNKEMVLRHADDAVIAEFFLEGTMKGSLRGIPPTGKHFRVRVIALFVFEHNRTKLINERAYFDAYTVLQQLDILPVATLLNIKLPAKEFPIDRHEPGVFAVRT